MPLIARNGKLLRTATGLASSLDCCCGDPPLPPCACPPVDCIPNGQPSSIKIEVEITDTWEWRSETDLKYCTFNGCNNTFRYGFSHQGISGLSQFNGTYECEYWADKGDGLELADPQRYPCNGWWVFPRLTHAVDVWHYGNTIDGVDGCGGTAGTVVYDTSIEATLYTHNARLEALRPLFGGGVTSAWPSFGLSPGTLFGGINHPFAEITRSIRRYECDTTKSDIITPYTWSVASGACPIHPGNGITSMGIGPNNSGTSVGPPFSTMPDAIPGARKSYSHGTNPICYIGDQVHEIDLPAYESEWINPDTSPCTFDQRNGQFHRHVRGKAYWSAANYKITCVMEP